MVSYLYVKNYQKKLMIQSWENVMMDRRTDRQTDESFIGRCPTNVERPKRNINDVSDLHYNANNDPAMCTC